jgi:hypothetical protein
VRLAVSVDLSSPQKIGGLDTFDPMDPRVSGWWQKRVGEIYRHIPDFGGFTVKADSEGREGPSSYGRTPADAANMLARALKPHGGILFYRAFVYDHNLDWKNPKNDRARAAYDIFHPLDGKFDDNVVIQIKHGPVDFQTREPVSPIFAGLQKTSTAVELPVMQEYTGQQRHMVFLMPYWKNVLDFDLQANGRPGTAVKDILAGKSFKTPTGGYVAVVNVGTDPNWLGHPMGMANLYGFGRLAWNPDLSSEAMQLNGYALINITPWENSSGGKGVECATAQGCSAVFRFDRTPGWYGIDVEYYDQNNGASKFRVFVNNQVVDEWVADNRLTAKKPGGDSSSRRRVRGLALRPGDEIRIEGIPDKEEHAGLDFIAIKKH